MPADTPIARYLRTHRETVSLTQTQLAAKVGCTQAAVSSWESGTRTPALRYIPQLAVALEVKSMELIDRIAYPDDYNDDEQVPA